MNRRDVLVGATALAACSQNAESQAPVAPFPIRRGVNLGNALEAPNEGDWGYRIENQDLQVIAQAGFDGVRLPVRWDSHTDSSGLINAGLLARVHQVVSWAVDLDLGVQLDVHHYEALIENPYRETGRFLSLWRQIGESFATAPAGLLFELLNEPSGAAWNGARLRDLQAAALEIVRPSNPERVVVLGPGNWQNIDALRTWRPPEDKNICVSVHYYEPHNFTHQNAEWLGADAPAFGRDWGSDGDRATVRMHIQQAADWGARHGYAMQLGEFGVNRALPIQQRAMWTRAARQACESTDMAWCVWDFAGAFPIYDRTRGEIFPLMRDALFA